MLDLWVIAKFRKPVKTRLTGGRLQRLIVLLCYPLLEFLEHVDCGCVKSEYPSDQHKLALFTERRLSDGLRTDVGASLCGFCSDEKKLSEILS